ncbi:MAG: NADAR family protein [Chitinophagales bacterium]
MNPSIIKFYSTADEYGDFSNFALFPIKLKGKMWATSEHYFQAQKFKGMPHEAKIRKAAKPMLAAQMGRSRKVKLRLDWEKVKDSVMLDAVRAKFTQYEELKDLLISTGAAKIVEHTANDSYWGDGGDGKGKNRLGQILMLVRKELKEKQNKNCIKHERK